MDFIIGALGAVAAISLLMGGGAAGWFAHKVYVKNSRPTLPDLGEVERQKLIEQQRAFSQMQNYSAERAYGMGGEG